MWEKIKGFFKSFTEKKRFKKGIKKLDSGYYQEAEEIFWELKDGRRIKKEMIYFNLAGALIGQEKMEAGEKYLNKALAINDQHDFLWSTLAEVNIVQRKWQKAEKAVDKALELEPEKKVHEAKKDIICGSQELKENYLKHFALIKESVAEQKKENWEKAVELLKKAAEYYDETGYVYNKIGAVYYNNLKNKELAAEYIEKALKKEPDNPVFTRNLENVSK